LAEHVETHGDNLAALSPSNSAVGGNPSPVPEPFTLVLVVLAVADAIGQKIVLRRHVRRTALQ
jgi:hypothetical protein